MTPQRVHGGPDAAGPAPHDFSTSANAAGPCPAALAAVRDADLVRYPDPAYEQLRLAVAERHGVGAERVVVAGSGSEFIFRFTAALARGGARTAAWPEHAYGDYAAAAQAWGLQADGPPQLAWACEPSSPLGVPDRSLAAPAKAGTTLIVDRAYEPLRLEGRATPTPPSAWELWTPNKALGLTGVRGAYAIAPAGAQELVERLHSLAPSWVLGAHGLAMLGAWCTGAVGSWLRDSLPTLRAWKARQQELCARLGWEVLPSEANYFTCRAPLDARRLRHLREQGVQLRDCTSFGLPGHVRLGVRPPASQDALRAAWEALR
ncbi:MAG TPA: aminotransferase class I/II-fold pyridoxal phosphate-dependent enzyme [Ramlibacter sp.]|nr:aminotransferase class I/II-fold pyridoxal phosphate-dependent enzyme [Ramlibacter sp.]